MVNPKTNIISFGLLTLAASISFIKSTQYKLSYPQYLLTQEFTKLKDDIKDGGINSFIKTTITNEKNNEILNDNDGNLNSENIQLEDAIEDSSVNDISERNRHLDHKVIKENKVGPTQLTIKYRKSLNKTLKLAGICNKESNLCIKSILKLISKNSINRNTPFIFTKSNGKLEKLEFPFQKIYKIKIINKSGNFIASKEKIATKKKIKVISAPLHKIEKKVVPILNTVKQKVKKNTNLQLVYEEVSDLEGKLIDRNILGLSAIIDGQRTHIYKYNNVYIDASGTILNENRDGNFLIRPINSWKITSPFGVRIHPISGRVKFHTGIDLSAKTGTPIKAAASGIVSQAGPYAGYGNYISINHSNMLKTNYGHLSIITVKRGQCVKQGEIIGYSGSSGTSTAPHLHYEVLRNGHFINPLSYIPNHKSNKLIGAELKRFNKFKHYINLQIRAPLKIR